MSSVSGLRKVPTLGRRVTSAGNRQYDETPTMREPRPRAKSVSVMLGEVETIRPPELEGEVRSGSDPALEALYLRNVRSISMINRGRGIRTIWVGQILNVAVLHDDKIYGWLPFVRNKDIWPLLSRFNERLREEAVELGDTYVAVNPEDFAPEDFRDNGHFLETGSLKLARLLAPQVARLCRRGAANIR